MLRLRTVNMISQQLERWWWWQLLIFFCFQLLPESEGRWAPAHLFPTEKHPNNTKKIGGGRECERHGREGSCKEYCPTSKETFPSLSPLNYYTNNNYFWSDGKDAIVRKSEELKCNFLPKGSLSTINSLLRMSLCTFKKFTLLSFWQCFYEIFIICNLICVYLISFKW